MGVQCLLAVGYTDTLYLSKKRALDIEKQLQEREGFDAITVTAWDLLSTWDVGILACVWFAPLLMFYASKYSTTRWIHSLKLKKNAVEVVTYTSWGSKLVREMPTTDIKRAAKSSQILFIQGTRYLMSEKGTVHEPQVISRVFQVKT
jgi:hypothetical protein